MTEKTESVLEEKELIEPELLEQEAKLLKVPQGYNLWKEMEMFPFAYGNLKTDTIRVFGKSYQ